MDSESILDAVKDFTGTLALMALLPVVFGAVLRRSRRPLRARLGLGLVFGAAAVAAMFDPLVVSAGVIVDLRVVPVALAGAFLGLEGAAVAVAMAALMRWGIGGQGAVPGIAGLVLSGALGLLWARATAGRRRGLPEVAALAALLPVHWVAVAMLPWTVARPLLLEVLPFVATAETAGIVLIGLLMERERRLAEEKRRLAQDADHDSLTGLLNRRGFERAVASRPRGEGGALLLLDLDHFKLVNDRHGHAAGDAVLRAVADRLRGALRPGQILGRVGGEEVAVFLPGLEPDAAHRLAHRLREEVGARPFDLPDGGLAAVTASLGGARGEGEALGPLMARADAALYAAKRAGRDRCRFLPEREGEEARPADAPAGDDPCDDGPLRPGCKRPPRRLRLAEAS